MCDCEKKKSLWVIIKTYYDNPLTGKFYKRIHFVALAMPFILISDYFIDINIYKDVEIFLPLLVFGLYYQWYNMYAMSKMKKHMEDFKKL